MIPRPYWFFNSVDVRANEARGTRAGVLYTDNITFLALTPADGRRDHAASVTAYRHTDGVVVVID